MTITVTGFKWVPDFARGEVRDLRVRWALEEAAIPYQERLIGFEDQATDWYRKEQPFGQVPVYQEDDLILFESGAIVLHIAEKSTALSPPDAAGRARMQSWVLAALNSIEPWLLNVCIIDLFHPNEEWAKARRPGAVEFAEKRLKDLAGWLGDKEWLEDRFTAGDLMMSTVLRILHYTDIVEGFPNLAAYKKRCEARSAFKKALADQLASFEEHPPTNL